MLEDIGFLHVWVAQDALVAVHNWDAMCVAYRTKCIEEDVFRLILSTSNPVYYLCWSSWKAANYLKFNMPFYIKSVISQIRLNAQQLYFKGFKLSLGNDYCYFCDCITPMSLEHLLLRCRSLSNSRNKCPLLLNSPSYSHLIVSLSSADEPSVKSVFYFVVNLLKIDHPS